MTYHLIYPAPEFDSGVEKRIKQYFFGSSISMLEFFNITFRSYGSLYLFLSLILQTYRSYRSSRLKTHLSLRVRMDEAIF